MVIENVRRIILFSFTTAYLHHRCIRCAEKVDLHTPQRPSEGNRSDGCRSSVTKRLYDFPARWKNRYGIRDRLNRSNEAKLKMSFYHLASINEYSYILYHTPIFYFFNFILNVYVTYYVVVGNHAVLQLARHE